MIKNQTILCGHQVHVCAKKNISIGTYIVQKKNLNQHLS